MSKNIQFRTDLALEFTDTTDNILPKGVYVKENSVGSMKKTIVSIKTQEASERIGRPKGEYVTIESDLINQEETATELAKDLSKLLPKGAVLVVGLGNRGITPDTLGPLVTEKIIVTRHIPMEQRGLFGTDDLREVSAIAPGVMGQTGIETAHIIKAVADSVELSGVLVVDALAARSQQRLGRTIQLSNVGISPGSGVHNRRSELSEKTLGVPVISMGIPTVVDAATLILDNCPSCEQDSITENMIVTPRDIDSIIKRGGEIISVAINMALFPQLSYEDVCGLME